VDASALRAPAPLNGALAIGRPALLAFDEALARERRCIDLAAAMKLRNSTSKSLGAHIFEATFGALRDPLAIILLPLILIALPYTIWEGVRFYRNEQKELRKIRDAAPGHSTPFGSIAALWSKFGLSARGEADDDQVLTCLMAWFAVLYDGDQALGESEIRHRIAEAEQRQGEIINRVYAQGGRITMESARSSAIRQLLADAPEYWSDG
jgi:hypothetical protein